MRGAMLGATETKLKSSALYINSRVIDTLERSALS